jgi:hypothetical protein
MKKPVGATDRNDPAGRLKLLETNADVYRQILPQIARATSDAVVLVLTDPSDPLADLVRAAACARVLSSARCSTPRGSGFTWLVTCNSIPRPMDHRGLASV